MYAAGPPPQDHYQSKERSKIDILTTLAVYQHQYSNTNPLKKNNHRGTTIIIIINLPNLDDDNDECC